MLHANLNHNYNNLIDGGNTDALVDEIQLSWPSDAWDLRNELLARSPFLSVEVLKEAVNKSILPHAMILEICLANPEATKQENFMGWLKDEAPVQLPTYMLGLIESSWNVQTMRFDLEGAMAVEHNAMSAAHNRMLDLLLNDTTSAPMDTLLLRWQQMPNLGARSGEVAARMRLGQYTEAQQVVQDILLGKHTDAQGAEWQRMGQLLTFLQGLYAVGKDHRQLGTAEVAQLQAIATDAHDLPATWAQNILCFHYGVCLPVSTGGDPNNRAPQQQATDDADEPQPLFRFHPNPAGSFTIVDHQAVDNALCTLVLRDIHGKAVREQELNGPVGQTILSLVGLSSGIYTCELMQGGERLAMERLVVR